MKGIFQLKDQMIRKKSQELQHTKTLNLNFQLICFSPLQSMVIIKTQSDPVLI